ncbi:hypothetical protein EVB79_020 [Rhizobium phage RHph_N3_13]|nr:hypothetical protein EVB79_020 [Rhizobium phage RHph_N3_13]
MTKVFIIGLDDLSVGDILFFPQDESVHSYRVTGLRPGEHDCVGLEYKKHHESTWHGLGNYPITTACRTYKIYETFKYDPNQAGDTEDDI